MAVAVPPITGSVLVTCEYNDSVAGDPGMVWVILHDNPVLAWLVDETGTTPVVPVILGTSAVPPPDTGEIMSPPWAVKEGSTMFIPDMARGVPGEMFTFLAVNNGATRKLYANFANYELAVSWNDWARSNPSLALTSPPNVAPPPDAF